MRKHFISILLICLVSVCFVACGNADTQPTEQTESTEQSTPEPTIEPEPTAEPEEVVTTEQTEETAEPTTEPEELTTTPEPIVEPTAQYTYTDLSATMYAQQNVNIRDLPSADGNKLGGLSTNQEVAVTGQCNETSWYRFEYNGSVAYVSNNYLSDTKVEVAQAPAQSTDNSGSTTQAETPCPVDLYVIHDEGNMIYMWGEFHNPACAEKTLAPFNQLNDYARGKWGDSYLGYQDCSTHVWWMNDGFYDSLCRWVYAPN